MNDPSFVFKSLRDHLRAIESLLEQGAVGHAGGRTADALAALDALAHEVSAVRMMHTSVAQENELLRRQLVEVRP